MKINRWWDAAQNDERYWLETTDRSNIGVDLNAPQRDERGERWSYSLIHEIRDGDVVFHYYKPTRSINAWSRAVGTPWDDDVIWGARGTSARSHHLEPYRRPGWRLGLEGPYELSAPVVQSEIAENEVGLRRVREDLAATYGGTAYFPFELSDRRPPRATQAYLTKFPVALLEIFPVLSEASPSGEASMVATPLVITVGAEYREADENAATGTRDPFTVDPTIVDRGLRGHARTQNALAKYVIEHGHVPLRPRPTDPQFDLAWFDDGGSLFVAEVKSLSVSNEEQQLRLGLGQLLRYRQLLTVQTEQRVRGVLAVERRPTDQRWQDLCDELDVCLVWPGTFTRLAIRA
jgi:hypothetical protein